MRTQWGGRFAAETHAAVKKLNDSLAFDQRLWREDIDGSIAHATMLGETGIISANEAATIVENLEAIMGDLQSGATHLPCDAEDIHSAIESMLKDRIGPVAGKLHTARSRNDQVATDLRLFIRKSIDDLIGEIRAFQEMLVQLAELEIDTIMPGYTHLQHAQPVLLSHHLMAYFWMLQRDRERLSDARKRVNVLPLGSGALAGTSFPIDRDRVAELLAFDDISANSMDAVSDRDFVVEFLSAAALLSVHLSRFGEEIVLWNSQEFKFIDLDDAFATGSSMMPQKKNPDVAELARGKTGRVVGHLVGILVTLKGLPLSYNKDMQEDKEPVFNTVDTLMAILAAFRDMLATAKFDRNRMAAALSGDYSTATDLADKLVQAGLSFREAHERVGNLVLTCVESESGLENSSEDTMARAGLPESFDLSPAASIARRKSYGSASKQSVLAQLRTAYGLMQVSGPTAAR